MAVDGRLVGEDGGGDGGGVSPDAVPPEIPLDLSPPPLPLYLSGLPLLLAQTERSALIAALVASGGNQRVAARVLEITRWSMIRAVRRLDLAVWVERLKERVKVERRRGVALAREPFVASLPGVSA